MDLRLLTLLACCAFMAELGVQGVAGSVYVKGGSRYPFPRPQYSNAEATNAQTNPSSSNKHQQQPLSRAYYIESNRRVQRQILNSKTTSIPSLTTHSAANGNSRKQPNTQAVFEDQRPIDFDLNVRPMAHFIPGLKSVKN
ncbi:uncharacterized protein LOC124189692 [Daphnia pulex]|uniref:uncharacterized protein LOC124189692 n=1 Tax=Daphnia pulex TaxID=6669 RepID=UPI001EE1505B|nr:uncharacterized protein LOC124189692 [Daphnia pulex]